MDANKLLDEIRRVLDEIETTAYTEPLADSRLRVTNLAVRLAGHFRRFDSHLSAGGSPPEAWREGPDEPYMDEGHDERPARDDDYTTAAINRTADEL